MSVLDTGPGTVEIALDAAPHHLNLQGVLHGGMIATLADTAAGLAVRTELTPGRTHVTTSLTVPYLRPGGCSPPRAPRSRSAARLSTRRRSSPSRSAGA